MSGYQLIAMGFVLILTPAIQAFRAGAFDEADLLLWLMSQPLQILLLFKSMIVAGAWLIRTGVLMINLIR